MRMAATFGSAGYVVEVIDALNLEGHMLAAFNKGQVSARIGNLWQIDNSATINVHLHVSLFEKSYVPGRIALNQTFGCNISGYNRACPNHRSRANHDTRQDNSASPDRCPLFKGRCLEIVRG